MPVQVSPDGQVDAAGQDQHGRGFTQRAAGGAKQHIEQRRDHRVVTKFQVAQRRRAGHGVCRRRAHERQGKIITPQGPPVRAARRPGRDRHREGSLQEGATEQCRVEDVLPQAAKDDFSEANAKDTAEESHPQRKTRRQAQPQQQAGDHGRAIGNGVSPAAKKTFGEQAAGHTGQYHQQGAGAEEPDRGAHYRQQAQDHRPHDPGGRFSRTYVRGGGNFHGGVIHATFNLLSWILDIANNCDSGIFDGQT